MADGMQPQGPTVRSILNDVESGVNGVFEQAVTIRDILKAPEPVPPTANEAPVAMTGTVGTLIRLRDKTNLLAEMVAQIHGLL